MMLTILVQFGHWKYGLLTVSPLCPNGMWTGLVDWVLQTWSAGELSQILLVTHQRFCWWILKDSKILLVIYSADDMPKILLVNCQIFWWNYVQYSAGKLSKIMKVNCQRFCWCILKSSAQKLSKHCAGESSQILLVTSQ